jgi:predicted dehydrogenase
MQKVRVAVVGVGYLGKFHAQKYAAESCCNLVAVVDVQETTCRELAAQLGTTALTDYRALIGRVDAVSIATTTPHHYPIAKEMLTAGIHVLVEKPITETPAQARELIELAQRTGKVLQVGHLERFNPAVLAAEPFLTNPQFIECHRLAPFKSRGTDVNVVLDLMIHDLDIVQTIVGAPIATIDAIGAAVFSGQIDIANARIRFTNGCVANATASRVSLKTERKLRIFKDDTYLSIDLQQKILTTIRKRTAAVGADELPVLVEEQQFDSGDALQAEIASFLNCVMTGTRPLVSGEAGLNALETALRISQQVRHN